MEEVKFFTQDDVLDVITGFPIEPLHNNVVITINTVQEAIKITEAQMDEVQYVIAKGPTVIGVEPGQKVLIDLGKLTVRVPNDTDATELVSRVSIEPIVVDDVMYAIVSDRVIKAKDNR